MSEKPTNFYYSSLPFTTTSAQPVGQPEVSRLSLTSCTVKGGKDLFIIGKNFMKGTKVYFRETVDESKVIWEKEAEIEKDYFQPVSFQFQLYIYL